MKNKTVKQKTKYYQDQVLHWIEKFGLGRWSVKFIDWTDIPESHQDGEAAVAISVPERLAKFAVNPDHIADKGDTWIERSALHEVDHMRNERLAMMAKKGGYSEEEIEEEMEALAKSMERFMYGMVDAA